MVHLLDRNEASRSVDRLLRLAAAGACMWTLSAASAQATHARSLLTPSQIITAMQDRQLPTRGVEVRLAASITSTVTNPPLEIQAIAPLNSNQVRLRMTCRDRSECLPFFAFASYPETIDASVFQIKSGRQPAASPQGPPATKPIAEVPAASPSGKPANSSAQPVIRSGSSATLDFDGDRVHVRVEVICLESGSTGDKIHVTTRDHKQIYVAEIVAPRALKGTLTK